MRFEITSNFEPCGDQPKAIDFISQGIMNNKPYQTLLGVTGSGKTYTMAKIIEKTGRPSLIIAHNKTLAAQLYREFKRFFPNNAVHYFVSYYDYYQPEAYLPATDTYIEKDAAINEDLDRMRHAATQSLFERRDVIIVASVSCIYGLGSPIDYNGLALHLHHGQTIPRHKLLHSLVELNFNRNDLVLLRSSFRVKGDCIEIFGAGDEHALRIELFGDEIEKLCRIDALRGTVIEILDKVQIFPASHYATASDRWPVILTKIRQELQQRLEELAAEGKLLERQRLLQRTEFDLEMLELTGYCTGIENYSRHLTGRNPGEPPPTLLDYLPQDAIIFIDESHVTLPQLRAMYRGDRSRKDVLCRHGFRLSSALDNRPLTFEEFTRRTHQTLFISATPSNYELEKSGDAIVEQIIRPTGLLDPQIIIRPAHGQIDDLYEEIKARADRGERTLVTTLTKKMAENLSEFYIEMGLKVCYLHSDVKTLERVKLIRELRIGKYSALIGINLLREGLDLPEVSLVAILDADQEGFLRSTTSLIQTIGRCARHVSGQVILYADRITRSMQEAIHETNRRREIQRAYNIEHHITPRSVYRDIEDTMFTISDADYVTIPLGDHTDPKSWSLEEYDSHIEQLEKDMFKCAKELKFEEAARIRDRIQEIRLSLLTHRF